MRLIRKLKTWGDTDEGYKVHHLNISLTDYLSKISIDQINDTNSCVTRYCSLSASHSIPTNALDYCFRRSFDSPPVIELSLLCAYRPVFALAEAWIGAAGRVQWIGIQVIVHAVRALDSVELRLTRLGWLVQAVHFWLVGATKKKGKKESCVPFVLLVSNLSLFFSFSLSSLLHYNEQRRFSTLQIIFHERNIHWLMPSALRPFLVIMALRLGRGRW